MSNGLPGRAASFHHRTTGTICVPVRPAPLRRCCASSASPRDANGPETTCCQPSETRRRIGSPSAATSLATDAARASVRNDATTMSKRTPVEVAASADGATGALRRRWCSGGRRCLRRQCVGAHGRRVGSRGGRASRGRSRRCCRGRCLCRRRSGPTNAEQDGHGHQGEGGHQHEIPCRAW